MLISIALFFGLVIYAGLWYLCLTRYCAVRFENWNFYVTDLWAATLAFCPSIFVLSRLLRENGLPPVEVWLWFAMLWVFQLLGIGVARQYSDPNRNETLPRRLPQAEIVFLGGLLGAASYLFFWALLVIVAICITLFMSIFGR